MESVKIDQRVRYTRDILRRSLLDLMKRKPISAITVSDVCRKADINRGTFYKHYRDSYDLLSHIQDELYERIFSAVERTIAQNARTSALEELFISLADNGDICRLLLSENGDKAFLRKLLSIVHDKTVQEWKKIYGSRDSRQHNMIYTFVVSGSMGVIQEWIEGGLKQSPHEIAQFINTMANRGMRGEFGETSR